MLIFLVLPIVALVAAVQRCVRRYAPSNQLIRQLRTGTTGGHTVAAFLTLAATSLVATRALAAAVAAGAPSWLNLVVFVLAFDAIKFGLQAIAALRRLHRT